MNLLHTPLVRPLAHLFFAKIVSLQQTASPSVPMRVSYNIIPGRYLTLFINQKQTMFCFLCWHEVNASQTRKAHRAVLSSVACYGITRIGYCNNFADEQHLAEL